MNKSFEDHLGGLIQSRVCRRSSVLHICKNVFSDNRSRKECDWNQILYWEWEEDDVLKFSQIYCGLVAPVDREENKTKNRVEVYSLSIEQGCSLLFLLVIKTHERESIKRWTGLLKTSMTWKNKKYIHIYRHFPTVGNSRIWVTVFVPGSTPPPWIPLNWGENWRWKLEMKNVFIINR